MAAQLQGTARTQAGIEAYELFLKRLTYGEIGKKLGISRQLASTIVKEEQARQWETRDLSELDAEKQKAIATYDRVIRGALERLESIKDNSLNVSGLYNVVITAQSKIDGITGIQKVEQGGGIAAFAQSFQLGAQTMHQLHAERKIES
jgi:hypothetical protein